MNKETLKKANQLSADIERTERLLTAAGVVTNAKSIEFLYHNRESISNDACTRAFNIVHRELSEKVNRLRKDFENL